MGKDWVELDGSFGEGGGQILRTSLALSLLTGKPFRLRNVRAGREKPGLQPQHLTSVQAAAAIGRAKVQGATLRSTSLVFEPGEVVPGDYTFRIGTAGSTGMVLHTLYLPLALAGQPSRVTLEGGTHVKTSPSFHFLDVTWRRYLELMGLTVRLRLVRAGFYPRGGGLVEADIEPAPQLRGLDLPAPAPVTSVAAIGAVAGLPGHIAARLVGQAADRLRGRGLNVAVGEEAWEGGPGAVLNLVLETAPVPTLFFGLGERGKPAEQVAYEAVDEAAAYLDTGPAGVDEHSGDQLLLPLALASGPSRFPTAVISRHLVTNAAVIRRFVEREIRWDGEEGGPGWVHVS